jgi:hypothetical protein
MTSEDQNFEMYAGESKVITVTVREPPLPDGTLGPLIDLTGSSIEWIVKRAEDDAVGLITKIVGAGIALLNQTTYKGQFTITLAPADTVSLGGASYYHEAEVTDVAGNVSTVTRGILTIKKALT